MNKTSRLNVFVFLSVFFTVALLVSNILSTKQVEFTSWLHTSGGFIVFPITYVLSDVFSEVYGYKTSRRISWLSFTMNLFMVLSFGILILLPYPSWWGNQEATIIVLGSTPRILIASLGAFQIGNWLNDVVFQRMRERQGIKGFWFRALASSVIGEAIDSSIFNLIAFIRAMPLIAMPSMVLTSVITKVSYEVVLMPFTIWIIRSLRKYEGEDVYQSPQKLGIFG